MKKRFALLCTAGILTASLVGCTNTSSTKNKENPQPETAIESQSNDKATDVAPTPDNTGLISQEEAERIALEKAGLTADEVRFERTELDRDGGIFHYDVEFNKGQEEYDAEISAVDGTILKFEQDYND